MKNTIATIIALIVLIGGLLALSAMGNDFNHYRQQEAQYAGLASVRPTLEEMNAYADKVGKPHMERLPWINPETGRCIYEERQEQLEELGIEGYRALHGLDDNPTR